MITFGFAKQHTYTGDNTLRVQVRIPSIHGPYNQSDYKGKPINNYTMDKDLPWYQSLLLPSLPNDGDVVALSSIDESNSEFIVLGLTGGRYDINETNSQRR